MNTGKLGVALLGWCLAVIGAGCGGNSTTGPPRTGYSSYNSSYGSNYGRSSGGISRPGAPTNLQSAQAQKNREDRAVRDIRVRGERAFCITQNSLLVLDLSHPGRPNPISQLPLPGTARALDVTATHAFVACGPAGLQVVDLTTPTKPRKVGDWQPDLDTQQVQGVALQDGMAYLAVQSAGLVVVDVSQPKEVKALTVLSEGIPDAQRVVAVGPRVYLLEPGLTIVDVAHPAQPKKLEELGAQRQTYDLGLWEDYVVTLTSLGVQVLDLRDLEKVRRVAQFETQKAAPATPESPATSPAPSGADKLLSQTGKRPLKPSQQLESASQKDSSSPTPKGKSAANPTTASPPPQNRRVALYRHYAYIARESDGLWIVDVRGEDDLKRVGVVTNLGTVSCCAIDEGLALVGNQEGGITILDLKKPTEPEALGRFEVGGK